MKPAHIARMPRSTASRRARALVAAFALLSAATHAVPAEACRCVDPSPRALVLPPSGRLPEDAREGTLYLIGADTSDKYARRQAATPPASPAEPDDDNDAWHLGLAALAIALLGIVGGLMVRASRNWSTPWADALAEEHGGGAGVRQHAGAGARTEPIATAQARAAEEEAGMFARPMRTEGR